ncbi:MAG: DNA-methyltransferase [Bacteroidota bacterium]
MTKYFDSDDFTLYLGDCSEVLKKLNVKVDFVFADPPYFLSNDGSTIQNGKIVSVNKGSWDKLKTGSRDDFNYSWLEEVRKTMNKGATIWISSTFHNIFSIYNSLKELNFRILNVITWEKTNPPPNYSKKFFTHSSELIIWARKEENSTHLFNYDLMKSLNDGKQMKDVWKLSAIAPWEKTNGKHPTQKPLSVLSRAILASTSTKSICLDPFTGSSTTGIAANLFDRKFIGIDTEKKYLNISIKRKEELDNIGKANISKKIYGLRGFKID